MRKWGFMALILVFTTNSQARQTGPDKGKITGKVTESVKGLPLEYATITVFDKLSGKTITGTTTNEAGQFTITALRPGH
jgi:hypothetical protein